MAYLLARTGTKDNSGRYKAEYFHELSRKYLISLDVSIIAGWSQFLVLQK